MHSGVHADSAYPPTGVHQNLSATQVINWASKWSPLISQQCCFTKAVIKGRSKCLLITDLYRWKNDFCFSCMLYHGSLLSWLEGLPTLVIEQGWLLWKEHKSQRKLTTKLCSKVHWATCEILTSGNPCSDVEKRWILNPGNKVRKRLCEHC